MDKTYLVPKSTLKSKSLWFLILALVGMAAVSIFDLPPMISYSITALSTIFIGSEKMKDGKTAASLILSNHVKEDLNGLTKPIVDEKTSKYVAGVGIILNVIYSVLAKNGMEFDPALIISANGLIGAFVGFDKYKAAKIKVAEAFLPTKEEKDSFLTKT